MIGFKMSLQTQQEEYDEREINFRETVQPGQGVRVTNSFREAGKITQIMFHFPPGSNALVEVALFKDGKAFYPLRGYVALNDATPVYYVEADYYKNEPLTVEILNKDSVNAHTITCTVVIRYKKPWWRQKYG